MSSIRLPSGRRVCITILRRRSRVSRHRHCCRHARRDFCRIRAADDKLFSHRSCYRWWWSFGGTAAGDVFSWRHWFRDWRDFHHHDVVWPVNHARRPGMCRRGFRIVDDMAGSSACSHINDGIVLPPGETLWVWLILVRCPTGVYKINRFREVLPHQSLDWYWEQLNLTQEKQIALGYKYSQK